MKFNSLIPELTVTNIEKSKEFYQNIGFEIMYERKENKFCFLQLEDNQIMIEEQNDNWNVHDNAHYFHCSFHFPKQFIETLLRIKNCKYRRKHPDNASYDAGYQQGNCFR